MKYQQKTFSVPASGKREGECKHEWVAKGRCVLCGERMASVGIVRDGTVLPVTMSAADFHAAFKANGYGIGADDEGEEE